MTSSQILCPQQCSLALTLLQQKERKNCILHSCVSDSWGLCFLSRNRDFHGCSVLSCLRVSDIKTSSEEKISRCFSALRNDPCVYNQRKHPAHGAPLQREPWLHISLPKAYVVWFPGTNELSAHQAPHYREWHMSRSLVITVLLAFIHCVNQR